MGMARRLQAGHARWHNVQFGTQSDEFVFVFLFFVLFKSDEFVFFFSKFVFFFIFIKSSKFIYFLAKQIYFFFIGGFLGVLFLNLFLIFFFRWIYFFKGEGYVFIF